MQAVIDEMEENFGGDVTGENLKDLVIQEVTFGAQFMVEDKKSFY